MTFRLAMLIALAAGACGALARPTDPGEDAHRMLSAALRGGKPPAGPDKCGLPAVSFALHNRATLSPALQAALRAVMTRSERETSRSDGRFRVHYDTSASSPNTPAMLDASHQRIPGTAEEFVDSVFSVLRYVVHVEVDSLGYPFPPSDGTLGGGPEYDVYILGNLGAYAYTDPDSISSDGGLSTTSMSIDRDFSFVTPDANKGLPALRVTIAHEFHHAIQIGRYGYWVSHPFFYEITSVWLEDFVYPGVNDYLNYVASTRGQFRNPGVIFDSNDDIMYSRGIWGKFIARKYGVDEMRRTWEEIRSMPPLQAIDAALRLPEYRSTFQNAFAEWSLWNFFTGPRNNPALYYSEGALFPGMTEEPIVFSPPSRGVAGSLQNLASAYYQIANGPDTLHLVLSNLNFSGELNANPLLPTETDFLYTLNTRRVDDTYQPTSAGISYKFSSPDNQVQWWSWAVVGANVGVPPYSEEAAFPNPFMADGRERVYIPADGASGNLSIYSSAMDLIYHATQSSALYFGKRVFSWDGTTDKQAPARSGIYIYVLSLPGHTATGKIALVRR